MLRWYGAVEGVGPDEKILLSLDSSEVFEICATFIALFFLLCFQVMASMVLQQSVVESLLGFTAAVAEQCGDLLDGQSVDLEVGCCCC